MDRKNVWVAVLLPFLLVFCGAWAMDYPQVHEKKEICAVLEKTAKELRMTESIHNLDEGNVHRNSLAQQLSLLSEKLPHRKNKIDVLIKDLTGPILSNYGGILTQALGEICAEKKSAIEQAQEVFGQTLSIPEKLQHLELLYGYVQSKKPTQRLLKLLWEQDIKDFDAIRIALLSEQTKILGEKLQQERKIEPLAAVVDTLGFMAKENNLYNDVYRKNNIQRLIAASKILNRINMAETESILNFQIRVNYMLDILKMWQAFDDQSTEFDPYAFASTISSIQAYAIADFLSKEDIAKIQDLIKNQMFTNFIDKGFYTLDQDTQDIVLEACKKIRGKISNFPVPIEQAQILPESPVQAIAEQQDVALPPVLPEIHLTSEQTGKTPRIDVKNRPELVTLFRGWPQARSRDIVAKQPDLQPRQEALRDNNQPQDWWTKLSIALSELMKTISRIWRSIFG